MLQAISPQTAKILDLPTRPWADGSGVTRLLATDPGATSDAWNWRLSLATLAPNASFSPMGDAVRILTIASPGPVLLDLNGASHELSVGMQAQFLDSDQVTITSSSPEQYALSLVVRRGSAFGSVETQRLHGQQLFSPTQLWHRIIVLDGTVNVENGPELTGLNIIEPSGEPLVLHSEDALLAHVVVLAAE